MFPAPKATAGEAWRKTRNTRTRIIDLEKHKIPGAILPTDRIVELFYSDRTDLVQEVHSRAKSAPPRKTRRSTIRSPAIRHPRGVAYEDSGRRKRLLSCF